MESLRWILLAAGIIFVVVIYILGRSRRKRNHSMVDELEDDLPEFSAQNLDDVDEGVGQVRIITSAEADDVAAMDISAGEQHDDQTETGGADDRVNDIIVLYILPKLDQILSGAQINSSAQAMGLTFGSGVHAGSEGQVGDHIRFHLAQFGCALFDFF